jgi:hypothetical protein
MVTGIGFPVFRTGLDGWARSWPCRSGPVDSGLVALEASSETDAQITIRTAEGDTVAISLDSQLDATYAFYRRPRTGDGAGLRAEALTISASRDVAVSVQGDLNEQEMADISSLVKRLEQAIRSFLKGNLSAAVHQSLVGPSLGSLAGYALDIEHTDSLAVIRATDGANQDATTPGTVSKPVPRPMPVGPALDEGATIGAAPLATPGVGDSLSGPSLAAEHLLDEAFKAARDSGIDLAKSGRVLVPMLSKLLHQMGREPGMKPFRPALAEISSRLDRQLQGRT